VLFLKAVRSLDRKTRQGGGLREGYTYTLTLHYTTYRNRSKKGKEEEEEGGYEEGIMNRNKEQRRCTRRMAG